MSQNPQISCVSGTVEGRLSLLQRMVESVRTSAGTLTYEIILVACECSEDTLDWIRAQEDCVLVVRAKKEGSVVAFNDGFGRAKAKYVVTLNDDIAVHGNTLQVAYQHLESNPRTGQVAFAHRYQNRKGVDSTKGRVQTTFKYIYGQCCMTRRWLGTMAKWWGEDGLVHYAGDNHLSASIWNMGYQCVPVKECAVIDWEHEDDTRNEFSVKMRQANGGVHPDTKLFMNKWRGVLPPPGKWIPARTNAILTKAAQGNLRTLRFKAMMGTGSQYQPRTALTDVFGKYGSSKQANQNEAMRRLGAKGAQEWFIRTVREYNPDLVMLQAQRPNNIKPDTARRLKSYFPETFFFNWDADTHYPMLGFHAEIAKSVNLQLTISPSLFPWYMKRGCASVGYWPIGVEREFIDVVRETHFKEGASADVIFLGSLYGIGKFPEAVMRRDSVVALARDPALKLSLWGSGWHAVHLKARRSLEDFRGNPIRYSRSKMALSVSQTKDLWGYTSDRAYNILATGCPLLAQRFEGMDEHGLVDGESCIAWTTIPEMLQKAKYYVAHPQEREAIGQAGKKVLLARHTWDRRVESLFQLLARLGE